MIWRQVPRINLVSTQAPTKFAPKTLGLGGLLLVALGATAYLYLSLSSMKTEVEALTQDLDGYTNETAQSRDSLSEIETELQTIITQVQELDDGSSVAGQALEELRVARTDWAYGLDALLGVDGTDVRISKVVTQPNAKLLVTLAGSGFQALGTFQDHMRKDEVEDILELVTLNSASTESGFTIAAEIRVR